jgi:hypothetical protein
MESVKAQTISSSNQNSRVPASISNTSSSYEICGVADPQMATCPDMDFPTASDVWEPLCDTEGAQEESTKPELQTLNGAWEAISPTVSSSARSRAHLKAGMAELADAADSKSYQGHPISRYLAVDNNLIDIVPSRR